MPYNLIMPKTLSVAESCTGGLISHLITNVPGSSNYFKLGIVAYSNQAKIDQLKIPRQMIKKYGAVSRPVAEYMALSVKKLAKTNFGLAVTGIAGPGGATKVKPVGLVYIALAASAGVTSYKFNFTGNRRTIKLKAARGALNILKKYLLK